MAEKQYDNSSVWQGFVKIAEESGLITTDLNPEKKDFVGNPSKSPTGPFRDNGGKREKGDTELYGVTEGSGEDLIGKAHPETIQIADAMGAGGVVENQLEQQQKSVDIATKMPSGALYGVHAQLVKELSKKANELEKQGKVKEAMRIDLAIKRIAEVPFPNRQAIVKEALWPALILMGLVGSGGVAANLGFFSSRRENLATDLKDLQAVLGKAAPDSPSAKKAQALLNPFVSKFQGLSFESDKDIAVFSEHLAAFKPVLVQVTSLIARAELELGESRWYYFGTERISRIKAKLEDVIKDIKFIETRLQKISNVGKQVLMQQKAPTASRVSELQNILVEKGLIKKVSDTMDEPTIAAVATLEKQIDSDLDALGIKRKSSLAGKVVSNGKVVIEPSKLQRILSLIEMAKAKVKVK